MKRRATLWRSGVLLVAVLAAVPAGRALAEPGADAPSSEAMRFHLDSAPRLGGDDAPVTLVDFSDYTCPFCAQHALQRQPALIEQHVKTGILRYVALELPSKNPEAPSYRAAEAALCASDQGKYWEMRRRLFETMGRVEGDELVRHAEALDLDIGVFEDCLDSDRHAAAIQANIRDADEADVRKVPAFFLGLTDPDDPDVLDADIKIGGAKPENVFNWAIEELLNQSRSTQGLSTESGPVPVTTARTNEETAK